MRYVDSVKGDLTTAHGTVVDGHLINITSAVCPCHAHVALPKRRRWVAATRSTAKSSAAAPGRSSPPCPAALERRLAGTRCCVFDAGQRPGQRHRIHDFPVSEHYAIIPETPVYFSLKVVVPVQQPVQRLKTFLLASVHTCFACHALASCLLLLLCCIPQQYVHCTHSTGPGHWYPSQVCPL